MNSRPGTLVYDLEGLIPDLQSFLEQHAGMEGWLVPSANTAMRLLSRVNDLERMIAPSSPATDDHAAAEADAIERRAHRFAREG